MESTGYRQVIIETFTNIKSEIVLKYYIDKLPHANNNRVEDEYNSDKESKCKESAEELTSPCASPKNIVYTS